MYPGILQRLGRTLVRDPATTHAPLDSIDTGMVAGLRDRVPIGLTAYFLGRIGVVRGTAVEGGIRRTAGSGRACAIPSPAAPFQATRPFGGPCKGAPALEPPSGRGAEQSS
jgi:hypothetical protein